MPRAPEVPETEGSRLLPAWVNEMIRRGAALAPEEPGSRLDMRHLRSLVKDLPPGPSSEALLDEIRADRL